MKLKQSRGKTDYQGDESEGVYKSRTLENFSFIVHDLQLMFCVVDSSKHETSVISYHLVRWGEGGRGKVWVGHMVFRGNGGCWGISLRQQSIKGGP